MIIGFVNHFCFNPPMPGVCSGHVAAATRRGCVGGRGVARKEVVEVQEEVVEVQEEVVDEVAVEVVMEVQGTEGGARGAEGGVCRRRYKRCGKRSGRIFIRF